MTKTDESKGFRKSAASHLRKARHAKSPDEKELQADMAEHYKKLAASDELLENERNKKPRASAK